MNKFSQINPTGFQVLPQRFVLVSCALTLSAVLWLIYKSLPSPPSNNKLNGVTKDQVTSLRALLRHAANVNLVKFTEMLQKARDERRLFFGADQAKYEIVVLSNVQEILNLMRQTVDYVAKSLGFTYDDLNNLIKKEETLHSRGLVQKPIMNINLVALDMIRESVARENTSLKYQAENTKKIYQHMIRDYNECKPLNKKYARLIRDSIMADHLFYEYDIEWEDLAARPDLRDHDDIRALQAILEQLRDRERMPYQWQGIIEDMLKSWLPN